MKSYIASWIESIDEFDCRSHGRMVCSTFDNALAAARENAKKANVIEWISVVELEWIGDKRNGYWKTIACWSGDYDNIEPKVQP